MFQARFRIATITDSGTPNVWSATDCRREALAEQHRLSRTYPDQTFLIQQRTLVTPYETVSA